MSKKRRHRLEGAGPALSTGTEETEAAEPGLLRTGDVLERSGITHQVLYRYITVGLIEPALTTPTGQRLFRPNVVDLITIIQGLSETGYSLRHMKEIFFKDERVRKVLGR